MECGGCLVDWVSGLNCRLGEGCALSYVWVSLGEDEGLNNGGDGRVVR